MKLVNRSVVALLLIGLSSAASAKDFKLATLKQADNPTFDISKPRQACGTYYDLVVDKIAPAMEAAPLGASRTNVPKLKRGEGVSVKLGEGNYNVHINFPKSAQGGRSFGWTTGKVGDWSDSMYLRELAKLMDSRDEAEIKKFFKVVISMLGCSKPTGLESLKVATQRVATNFLAIYTAEGYRRIQSPRTEWDDALLQVTLLGAFHGGQDEFEMYYAGDFTDSTLEKDSGVYSRGGPGPLADEAEGKHADMEDYHQFSAKLPEEQGSKRSGINLTRKDFEKMGAAITRSEANNPNLKKIERIIGESRNVYAQLADYYATGKAKAEDTDVLDDAVAAFMIDTMDHANDISDKLAGRAPRR